MKAALVETSAEAGGFGFTTTHWSVVLAAQDDSPAGKQALEQLCCTYWPPVYAFIRRDGRNVEDAQDLTQSFFARLLERHDFDAVKREKGRLRSYLLVSLKHFLVNDQKRATSIKRGEGRVPIPLDELTTLARNEPEIAESLAPDRIYERRWALTVLEQALRRLADEHGGSSELCERFKQLLFDEPGAQSHAQIGIAFGMTENAVKQAFHRFRRRYRDLLREEITHTVAQPGEVEDELRHLVAVLRE